jgi:4-amino-4-deoxy-L-arabinose transferase-like glycosyltransferase
MPNIDQLLEYTVQYYATYPALSLGHHPLLLGIVEVPFYAIFGISVFSARLPVTLSLLLLGIIWFLLIKEFYDLNIAFLSSLLLITTPYLVKLSRIVMSEIPTLTLIVTSIYFLRLFLKDNRKLYLLLFTCTAIFSVYSKHTAVFMFPFYLVFIAFHKGMKRIFCIDILLTFIIMTISILPLALLTFKFSHHNVIITQKAMAFTNKSSYTFFRWGLYRTLKSVWLWHLTIPVFLLSISSILVSLYRRQKLEITFFLWFLILFLFSVYTFAPGPRHTIYWIPPFCLFAVVLVNLLKHRLWEILTTSAIVGIVLYQFIISLQLAPSHAYGYEEAAQYVVNNWKGEAILYSSSSDSGNFIFFIRKHNKNKKIIVLRADKILATSRLKRIFDDRIKDPKEIQSLLNTFGVSYVVLEDRKYRSKALEWLRDEVRTDRFVLRNRIIIRSNISQLKGTSLAIYEYKGYSKAKADEILKMNIPLIGNAIKLRFGDLLEE